MPWKPKDATRFTKRARTSEAKREWASDANKALGRGASEGAAIRMANAVAKRRSARGKR